MRRRDFRVQFGAAEHLLARIFDAPDLQVRFVCDVRVVRADFDHPDHTVVGVDHAAVARHNSGNRAGDDDAVARGRHGVHIKYVDGDTVIILVGNLMRSLLECQAGFFDFFLVDQHQIDATAHRLAVITLHNFIS
ncbi:hypothetical protein SDC9_176319 [bioreactor metagenome]|uniref:Uncharacterized protein n=1 Tax=bioreactor metagenome TaxID=1076179 RepID=A0A645GXW5_9ZZZZ